MRLLENIIERDLVTPAHDQYAYFVSGVELLLSHPSKEAHDAVLEFVRSTKMNTVAIEVSVLFITYS